MNITSIKKEKRSALSAFNGLVWGQK